MSELPRDGYNDLYNCFANGEHFEPTVFFCPIGDELTRKEFNISLEKFKAHGLNVFELKSFRADVPAQDVLITSLTYDNGALAFRLINLKLTTLMVYFDYGINVSKSYYFASLNFYCVLWKMFFASIPEKEYRSNAYKVGMPRGVYSGYPRMDIFFNRDVKFQFNWKMTHSDAKKIIWAPHHTVKETMVKSGLTRGTFSSNHQFIYEFAKAHPEISWVVQPHPWLLTSAIWSGIFPSSEALKEYLKKWDDLPNAQVYTGAYYQDVFATSDGMIHDSDSFLPNINTSTSR